MISSLTQFGNGGHTQASMLSAASRALTGGGPPTPESAPHNAWPTSQKHIDGVQKPHGYGSVRMPYAPQVAARTSPGVVPARS